MVSKKTLNSTETRSILLEAQREESPVTGSFLVDGKWRLVELEVCGCSNDFIAFNSETPCQGLRQNQPIGIRIHLGHFKYLFGSTVRAVESKGQWWRILLNFPDAVERIERRVYHRQPVPEDLRGKVVFRHCGYPDTPDREPAETDWHGILLNLSAGGARFEIEIEHKAYFRVGQLLEVEFTPMSCQRPLRLESHVKYAEEQSDKQHFRVGVEFLGLEASSEGRRVLNRLLDVISQYETMNTRVQACPNG